MPEKEPYSLNFQNASYDTTIFLINAHSNLLLYAVHFCLVVLFLLLLYCMVKCCPNLLRKTKNFLFWNGTIRLFIVNYLNILLLSLFNLKETQNSAEYFENEFKSVVASNWLSGILLANSILVPVGLSIYFYCNELRLNDGDFNNKVCTFIEGATKQKSSLKALIVPQSFFMKSLVLSLSLVFIKNIGWGQITCNFAIMTANLILIGYQNPYETPLENRL